MLNVFRDNLKHLKPVLWFVVVGLVLYLGYYFKSGNATGGPNWAARVDGTTLSTVKYTQALENMTEYYRKLMGERFEEIRPQLKLEQQVLQQLVDEQIKLHEAGKLGLTTSPEEIARYIQNDPRLRDQQTGQFVGKELYTRSITARWPGGVPDFEKSIGEMLTNEKWTALATESVAVSDVEVEDAYRARAEKTRIDYVVVPAAKQDVPMRLTEPEVAAWYASHTTEYQRGEGRKVRVIVVDRQKQAGKVQVSDADVQAAYTQNAAQYSRPEQRRVSHILFRIPQGATPEQKDAVRKKAEDALAKAKGGADFAALARQLSEDTVTAANGGDLGFFGKGTMAASVEDAAFSTKPGELAPVVESPFGYHVIRVVEERPAGPQPLAEVADAIRRQVQQQKAQELVQAEASRIQAEITSPAEFDAVASREGIAVEEHVLAREDRTNDLGASPQFIAAVWSQDPGTVSPPLGVARGMALMSVVENVPPSLRPLSEVSDRVRSDMLNHRKSAAAQAAAAAALAKHKTLAAAASANTWEIHKDVDAVPKQPLQGTGGSTPELDRALFSPTTAKGNVGTAPVPAGAILYEITQVEHFDPATYQVKKDGIRDELITRKRNDFLQATMEVLRNKYKDRIERNDALVESYSR